MTIEFSTLITAPHALSAHMPAPGPVTPSTNHGQELPWRQVLREELVAIGPSKVCMGNKLAS
jgi:hypothetical protein